MTAHRGQLLKFQRAGMLRAGTGLAGLQIKIKFGMIALLMFTVRVAQATDNMKINRITGKMDIYFSDSSTQTFSVPVTINSSMTVNGLFAGTTVHVSSGTFNTISVSSIIAAGQNADIVFSNGIAHPANLIYSRGNSSLHPAGNSGMNLGDVGRYWSNLYVNTIADMPNATTWTGTGNMIAFNGANPGLISTNGFYFTHGTYGLRRIQWFRSEEHTSE